MQNQIDEIQELKEFFANAKFPEPPFNINTVTTIRDPRGFMNYQFYQLRAYPIDSRYWMKAKMLLNDLKKYLSENAE